jgi:hypothetical protein
MQKFLKVSGDHQVHHEVRHKLHLVIIIFLWEVEVREYIEIVILNLSLASLEIRLL